MERLFAIPRDLVEEVRLLGARGFLFRLRFESLNRSGLRRWLEPIDLRAGERWRRTCTIQGELLPFWRQNRPRFFLEPAQVAQIGRGLRGLPGWTDPDWVVREAEEASAGRIRCFSNETVDFGDPIDWHLNPRRNVRWPEDAHWSDALRHEARCGDVKLSWEPGRFPQAFAFVRAWSITDDPRWATAFFRQVESWESGNPYRAGIHWASGQECAIRACAWLFALYAFGDSQALRSTDIERLFSLSYLHAEHIARHVDFARLSVHNNHLIGEALALYLIGSYFPWFKESDRWRRAGRHLLIEDCLRQFRPDGGYCQSSHTYHRLALQYYVWACRAAESLGDAFPQGVYDTLRRSAAFLSSFMNQDGRLPNWGANDGANFNPWNACGYDDFRPVIDTVSRLCDGRAAFSPGPWTEDSLWLWGPQASTVLAEPPEQQSVSHLDSGLHVLRTGPGDFGVMRCGSVRDRFGQADQLHVDLWWSGLNIAGDGGSYLYNDELHFHCFFMGTASHNTVTVDDRDQMLLKRRFKWLYWTPARLESFRGRGSSLECAGSHFGYLRRRGGVIHHRTLRCEGPGRFLITDTMEPQDYESHRYRLHWLLGPWEARLNASEARAELIQTTPAGELKIHIVGPAGGRFALLRGSEQPMDGWVSRRYGERTPVPALAATAVASGIARFESRFTTGEFRSET